MLFQHFRILFICSLLCLPTAIVADYLPGEVLIRTEGPIAVQENAAATVSSSGPSNGSLLEQATNIKEIGKYYKKGATPTLGSTASLSSLSSANPRAYYHLKFPDSELSIEELCRQLKQDPSITGCMPNYLFELAAIPNDSDYIGHQQVTVSAQIRAEAAWDITTGNNNIVIAVIDSGMKLDHPDLANKLWVNTGEIAGDGIDNDGNGRIDDINGFDFVNDDAVPTDDHGHGSHVSGLAAAEGNNNEGIAGICMNCKIMTLKAASSAGSLSASDVLESITYAVDNGANVINMSFVTTTFGSFDTLIQDKLNDGVAQNIVSVAAAGNNNRNIDSNGIRPAVYNSVLAISALEVNGSFASFSNFGSSIDVSAPGRLLYSARHDSNGYIRTSGTSMASPIVAGVVGLMKSISSNYSLADTRSALETTAIDKGTPGFDLFFGHGTVNAYGALTQLLADIDTVTPNITHSILSNDLNITRSVTAIVTDNITDTLGIDIAGVTLNYRYIFDGTPDTYVAVAMSNSGSTFTSSIPSSTGTPNGLQYYIEAGDYAGNVSTHPANAPTARHTLSIEDTTAPTITFTNDEGDFLPALLTISITDDVWPSINTLALTVSTTNGTANAFSSSSSEVSFSDNLLSINLSALTFLAREDVAVSLNIRDQVGNLASANRSFVAPIPALDAYGPRGKGSPIVNVPNPFNPNNERTDIWFQATKDGELTLWIYSLNLRQVKKLEQVFYAGVNRLEWDGRDSTGQLVPNGVYVAVLQLRAEGDIVTKRVKVAVIR